MANKRTPAQQEADRRRSDKAKEKWASQQPETGVLEAKEKQEPEPEVQPEKQPTKAFKERQVSQPYTASTPLTTVISQPYTPPAPVLTNKYAKQDYPSSVTYQLYGGIKWDKDNNKGFAPGVLRIAVDDDILVDKNGNPCNEHTEGATIKHISYVTGTIPNKTTGQPEPVKGEIIFNDGYLRLNPLSIAQHRKMYDYVEHCNRNASNPFRMSSVTPVFERLDPVGDKKKQAIKDREVYEISQRFNDRWTTQKKLVMEYAEACGIDMSQLHQQDGEMLVYADLMAMLKANPKGFEQESTSVKMPLRALVNKAMRKNVIKYSLDVHKYFWSDNSGEIMRVPEGREPKEELVEFLMDKDDLVARLRSRT